MDNCTVGALLKSECHLVSYTKKTGLLKLGELSAKDRNILEYRTDLNLPPASSSSSICLHHKAIYFDKYTFLQKLCCNPFGYHQKQVKKGLSVISVQQAIRSAVDLKIFITPGKKLCSNCRCRLMAAVDSITMEHKPRLDSITMEDKPRLDSLTDTETNLFVPKPSSEQNSEIQNCTIGFHLSIRCHSSSYTKEMGHRFLRDYSPDEINLLQLRTGLQTFHPESTICFHHEAVFYSHYTDLQLKCCNPFGRHKKKAPGTLLTPISEDVAKRVAQTCHIILVPGQKLCRRCISQIQLKLGDNALFALNPTPKRGRKRKDFLKESENDLVSRQSFEEKYEMEACDIGFRVSSKCPLKSNAKPNRPHKLRDLPATERNLLELRTGFEDLHPETTICSHHVQVFLKRYSKCQTCCCNPFGFHKGNVKANCLISENDATRYAIKYKIFLVPGKKICSRCKAEFMLALEDKQTVQAPILEEGENTSGLLSVNVPKSENTSAFSELKQRYPSLTVLRKRTLLNSLL